MTGTIKRAIAKAGWKLSGWKHVSTVTPEPGQPTLLIGAPHTSNWDFLFMLGIVWDQGVKIKYLGKDSLFKPPFGFVMRWFGGIPVNRANPYGLVEELIAQTKKDPSFSLVITPEGTRGSGKYWKSGFYRISQQTGMPLTLGFVDKATKTCGLGMTYTLTGDVSKDMNAIRAFYADKGGYRPKLKTEPRLKEEDRNL